MPETRDLCAPGEWVSTVVHTDTSKKQARLAHRWGRWLGSQVTERPQVWARLQRSNPETATERVRGLSQPQKSQCLSGGPWGDQGVPVSQQRGLVSCSLTLRPQVWTSSAKDPFA